MKSGRIRVLIVDDSLTIRAMMSSVLEKDPGIKVVGIAASAEEADEMLTHLSPDVITLDINMPGMNGLDFLSRLRRRSDTPVIMLSSMAPSGAPERIEALRRGAAASFNKANSVREAPRLLKMIKDAANRRLKPDPEDAAALALIAAQAAAPPEG